MDWEAFYRDLEEDPRTARTVRAWACGYGRPPRTITRAMGHARHSDARVIPLRGAGYEITPWSAEGDHGGGDRLMLEDIFLPSPAPDKYLRAADERAGACSILVGIAANRSLETGARVEVADLVGPLPQPDYPPMPSRRERLPMPARPN